MYQNRQSFDGNINKIETRKNKTKPDGILSQSNSFFPSCLSSFFLVSQSQPNGDVISAQDFASNGQESDVLKMVGDSKPFFCRQFPSVQHVIVTTKLESWRFN